MKRKQIRRRRGRFTAAGLVASAAAILGAHTGAAQRAMGAWRRTEPEGGEDDGRASERLPAAPLQQPPRSEDARLHAVTTEAGAMGPGPYSVDYPLREGIGDAELTLKPDGSWSVSFTVIPVCTDEDEEDDKPSDLPPLVTLMRSAIGEAARARDFEALEQLAFTFGDEFTYSFNAPTVEGSPGRFWMDLEEAGEDVLATLTRLLEMPYAHLNGVYVWPSVAVVAWSDVPRRDRDTLRRAFGDEQVAFWEEFGAYLDYRVGITSEGDWRFFVAGD